MNTNERINEMVRLSQELRDADNEFESRRSEDDRILALMKEDLRKLEGSNG
jgi:hypothetical protein